MNRRKLKTISIGSLAVAAIVMMFFVGFKVLTYYTGPIIGDSWVCSKGDVPLNTDSEGLVCVDPHAPLPKGFNLDPLGNRPFECLHRHGWEPITNNKTGAHDCMKKTTPLAFPPNGWYYDHYTITS